MDSRAYIERAIQLALGNVRDGRGGPFGAIVVRNGQVLGEGVNLVTSSNDPTAHAEVVAIRASCAAISSYDLSGCEIYASCEPCPMCLGAILWARLDRVYFAADAGDAARAGFDDSAFYAELGKPRDQRHPPMIRIPAPLALDPFEAWLRSPDRRDY
ncbi:MAG: nucleoside deaminase [Bryobacteraceae bacterium]|nr:nucleoside deaminase [Bryobacteraceae bacterium]